MTTRPDEPNPDEGNVEMHNGSSLFWSRNAAGGRTYWSDEIGGGVNVWDTCLVDFGTLCEAISMELALLGTERRAEERRERARPRTTEERFALLAGTDGPAGSTSLAPTVRPVDDGPCPNCGALGCWSPCPHEPPIETPLPEGVITFDGDTLPAELRRPRTHEDVTMRVLLARARAQLLRYSSEDPVAMEIERTLTPGAAR